MANRSEHFAFTEKYGCCFFQHFGSVSSLVVGLGLLLDELEAARAEHVHGAAVAVERQSALLRQVVFDVARHQLLGPLLPLLEHLLGCQHLVALEPVHQRDADDGGLDAGGVRQRRERQ